MNGILNLDFMHYTTVISLEMSDEPNKILNDIAKIQIKSEKLTLLEDFFLLWSNLMLF